MSVSLAMIPVALTLRLVMGKQNFDRWVESMEVKEPSTFQNELELVRTVRKAGYDAEKWGGSYKTHIDGEDLYFFWELDDGKWTAVFGKSDSKVKIKQFMADINQAAGRQIFEQLQGQGQSGTGIMTSATEIVEPVVTFPTNFRDGELLFRTLKEFGVNPVRAGHAITCRVEDSLLLFRQSQSHDSPFYVEVRNAPDLRKVYQYLSDVDEDYKRCLQAMVYEKLKERVEDKNMTIESEEVLEDNSIVLTINIRG
ncbi:hypothetical protein [Paenibacillus lentus]|uniref:Uncharacterized protein n=1 Tax=Paenibacillus lentus TaxID=1338368 RepID=A0A3Q8S3S1_9BACL|nr:hypothetical protein [Paenibacillus lentus]AZK45382.1 hypothetical protein EIM92_03490 [Paenibacillus lentus]